MGRKFYLKAFVISILYFAASDFANASHRTPVDLIRKLISSKDTARLNTLNELSDYYRPINFSRALMYAREARQLAKSLNNMEARVVSKINTGHIYLHYYDYQNALNFYNKAYLLARYKEINKLEAASLSHIANTYKQKNEINKAIDFYEKSLAVSKEQKDHIQIAETYSNIAEVYQLNNNLTKASDLYNLALNLQIKTGDPKAISFTYFKLGRINYLQNRYEESINFYKKALEIAIKANEHKVQIRSYLGIAECHQANMQFKKADTFLKQAESIALSTGNKYFLIETYSLAGTGFFHLHKKDEALSYLHQAAGVARETGTVANVKDCYQNLYFAYKTLNNPAKSLFYHEMVQSLSDSLYQHQETKNILEIQAKYQAEKKSKEIAILKKEKGEALYKAKSHAENMKYLFITLLLLTIIGGLLFTMYKYKQKDHSRLALLVKERTAQLEAKTLEKEIMLKEIHHRVKNNLQLISSLMSLQMHYKGEKETDELLAMCQHRIKCMALIHDKLYKAEELSGLNVQEYFSDLSDFILQGYIKGNTEIKMSLNVPEITLPIDKMIPCGLILNELVSNSFKYGFKDRPKGQIGITLEKTTNDYDLIISDNGIGIPENIDFSNLNSLGLTLVHDLVSQLDGKIKITNEMGTRIHITFPS